MSCPFQKKYLLITIISILSLELTGQFSNKHYLPVSVINTRWSVDDPQYRLVSRETFNVTVTVRNARTSTLLATLIIPPNGEVAYNSPYTHTTMTSTSSNKGIVMEGNGRFSVTGLGDPVETTMGFAWVSKGGSGLGKNFRAYAPTNDFRTYASDIYGNFYSVIATKNCQVTFSGFPQGNGTFSLNAGQCYTLYAGNSDNENLFISGIITSTEDIAVLNQTIQFYNGGINANTTGGSDDGADMLVPIQNAGSYYVAQEVQSDYISIIGLYDNTTITINGILQATINKGQSRHYDGASWVSSTMEIETNKPVYAFQLMSAPQSGYVLLPPVDDCGDQQTFSVIPSGNYNDQTLSIVSSLGASITIDGTPITPTSSNANYQFYIETSFDGTSPRIINSDKSLNVTASTYEGAGSTGTSYAGWGDVEAKDSIDLISSTCINDSIRFVVDICGNEGSISANYPVSLYLGNPFDSTISSTRLSTKYTSTIIDNVTCEQFIFKAPSNIINDSLFIVSNADSSDSLPLNQDSISSRCSPNRSIISIENFLPVTPTGTGGNNSVCGSNYFIFPVRNCATGTIEWYDNDSAGGISFTDSVQPSTTTTYYPFCNDSSCLSPAGDSAIVTCSPTVFSGSTWTWTGCTNTDWFNPCNWDRGSIPNTTSFVVIPPTANDPTISSGTANCFDITVQSSLGAVVNLNSSSGGAINILKP